MKVKSTKPEKIDDIEIAGDISESVIIRGDGNVIRLISGNDVTKPARKKGKGYTRSTSSSFSIIVALIGLIGTIIITLISSWSGITEFLFSDVVIEFTRLVIIVLVSIITALLIAWTLMVYYQKKITEANLIVKRLREKEVVFFESIENDFLSILNKEVQ
ncbi:MAG: hypothetical protein J0L96_14535 [Anaerolineae bacterium]|nr:hypothetical protein [Anaerolineae bacterium]